MTQPSRRSMRIMWKLHHFGYRVSGGRIGAKISGLPVLELTTIGRTSGRARSVLLTYLKDPRGYVVIASNAGSTAGSRVVEEPSVAPGRLGPDRDEQAPRQDARARWR